MKNLKHAIMLSLMGREADRFHEYQPARPLAERLDAVRRIEGVEGLEVVYPEEFADFAATVAALRDSGLPVAAVNLNVKSQKKWQGGSFTSTDAGLRAEAVADLKAAMDLAADLSANMVTCCPLIDGHNYSFQADYTKQWSWLEEGIVAGAQHRPEVKLSLEYKLNESRNFCILGDMGRTLYLCERLGLPNVGVTLDVGHGLMAKETPAAMACLAAQSDRLFYVHFNDNGREWDWDMLPGSVNCWDLVETLFYLDRLNWRGWVCYDVLTRNGNQISTMNATIAVMEAAERLMDKLGRETLEESVREGVPAATFRRLWESLA